MSGRNCSKILSALALLYFSFTAAADGGAPTAYTPYSIYGVGDLSNSCSAYNRTMAGAGVALRDNRYINLLNPAAVTARDSLSFMVDFSIFGSNKLYNQGDMKSAKNMVHIADGAISFPIFDKMAMYIGIMSYAGTGYGYIVSENNKEVIHELGTTAYSCTGTGGIYQGVVGLGYSIIKNLSIGAEADFYFGSIEQNNTLSYSSPTAVGVTSTIYKDVKAWTGRFGVQYEQPIGKDFKLGMGATYKLSTGMKGTIDSYMTSTIVDTVSASTDGVRFADELVVGISAKIGDKLKIAFDYSRSDWTRCGLDDNEFFSVSRSSLPFRAGVAQAFRLGAELVPNRNDIRYYYKRMAYRAGLYYKTDYFTVGGMNINSYGITLGTTLPVFRWYNGLTLGIEFGQRGTVKGGLARESYFNFTASVNLFDIWFQKPKYE